MTFEESLQKLAERWPEKFHYARSMQGLSSWFYPRKHFTEGHRFEPLVDAIGQDDIDEILGEIGWVYYVYKCPASSFMSDLTWEARTAKKGVVTFLERPSGSYPHTKLEAARAALVAVVEYEVQHETK